MSSYIHIPEPCHEDCDNMQPEEQGRYCLQCCKTVVDFTGWEVGAIAAYLKSNAGERVCGRFNVGQLQKPIEQYNVQIVRQVFLSGLPLVKKVAAIIIIFFGLTFSSCNDEIMGKDRMPRVEETMVGMILPDIPLTAIDDTVRRNSINKDKRKVKKSKCTVDKSSIVPKNPPQEVLQGDVQIVDTVLGKPGVLR